MSTTTESLAAAGVRRGPRTRPTPLPTMLGGPILAPLGVLAVVNSVGAAAVLPAVRHALADSPGGSRSIETAIWIGAAATPVLGLAAAALVTAALWSTLSLRGDDVPWRPLLRVALYAEAACSLQTLFMAGVLRLRGLESLRRPLDLQVPTGLDAYFDVGSPAMLVLAQHLGIFYVAWCGVLAWGTRTVAHTSWGRAVATALVPWSLGVLFALIQKGAW